MKTRTQWLILAGILVLLLATFLAGGIFVNAVWAQGPWQRGNFQTMHNNQALFQLLQLSPEALLQQRQAGTSLLDVASKQGVSEQQLLDTLVQPMTQMQTWMQQQFPQTNTTQMTEAMRQQFAQDIRVAQYGTMTDMHIFGGNGNWGMMGGYGNGYGGMRGGMMGGYGNGYGGMRGGMMNGWNNAPAFNATPVPSTQKVDREIKINAQNFKFDPTNVQVKKGETIQFTFTNQDNFAHNVISQDGKLAYTLLPGNQTTTVLWSAPQQAGTYTVICTFHPNMKFTVTVE